MSGDRCPGAAHGRRRPALHRCADRQGSTATLGILRLDWDRTRRVHRRDHARTYTTFTVDDPTVLCLSGRRCARRRDRVAHRDRLFLATAKRDPDADRAALGYPPTGPDREVHVHPDQQPLRRARPTTPTPRRSMRPRRCRPAGRTTYSWTFGDSSSGELNTSTLLKPVHLTPPGLVPGDADRHRRHRPLQRPESYTVVVDDSEGGARGRVHGHAEHVVGSCPRWCRSTRPEPGPELPGRSRCVVPSGTGDGQVGSRICSTHTCNTPGTYTVTLTVTDSLGNRATTAPGDLLSRSG